MDAVDRDSVPPQLHRQRLGHVHHGGVARTATEIAGVASIGARDVDDTAPALLLHEWNDGSGTAQCPDILHIEVLQQILIDYRLDGASRAGRAPWGRSAVDQDMYGAQPLGRLGDHAVNLLPARDVGDQRDDPPVGLAAQLAGSCLQISLVARNDRHVVPFPGQFLCDGFANTPTSTRHDGLLALQSEVHGMSHSWPRDRVGPSGHALLSCQGPSASAEPVGRIVGATYRDDVVATTGVPPSYGFIDRRTRS